MNNEQHPARRLRHGERPTEPLSFDDAPAAPAVQDLAKLPTFKSIVGEECVRLVDVQKWVGAAPALQVIDAPRVEVPEGWRNTLELAANKLVTYSRIYVGDKEALRLITELRAISEAPALPIARQAQPTDRDAWISVDKRLPEKYCLAVYETPRGQQRIIRAMYVKQYEIEATGDECDSETNDADDMEYIKAGWYECIDNWGDYSSVAVCEGVVTHWKPLPALPALKSGNTTEGAAS